MTQDKYDRNKEHKQIGDIMEEKKIIRSRTELTLKGFINVLYGFISFEIINLANRLPLLKTLSDIESGSLIDITANVMMSIIYFVIMLFILKKLYDNYNSFKTCRRCGAFNPFC